jgi:hypothetical protein
MMNTAISGQYPAEQRQFHGGGLRESVSTNI